MMDPDWVERPMRDTCDVIDVPLLWPVGFVWFSKPRYRVKAKSIKR
jgi:hypothetical protein